MSKYDPLKLFLQRQSASSLTLKFDEIDRIVPLLRSAKEYEWWCANEDRSWRRRMRKSMFDPTQKVRKMAKIFLVEHDYEANVKAFHPLILCRSQLPGVD